LEPLEVVHRTWHVKAAVRRCAARARRETRGTARDARSTDGRVRDPRETRARRVPRAFVSRCARAHRAEPTADFAEPVKRAIFPAAKSRMRTGVAYRRVERPRGVRSNLGSDLGRFARAVRAPLCKVVRDARRSVRRTRVETPFVASVLCMRALTQRRGAGVVRSRGRFACAVLDAYWSSGRFRDFPRTDRAYRDVTKNQNERVRRFLTSPRG